MFRFSKQRAQGGETSTAGRGYRVTSTGHIEVDLERLSRHPDKEQKLEELRRFSEVVFGDSGSSVEEPSR